MRRLAFAAFVSTAVAGGAFAQQADERQLATQAAPGNGQPFPQRSPLLAQQPGGFFEVPPLIERPLGLEEGPRVRVSQFRLTGAFERPRYGVSVEALNGVLRRHQAAQPPEGYTVNQLQAIADDLTRYYRERGLILAQAYVPAQPVVNGAVEIAVIEGTLGAITVEGNDMYAAESVSQPFAPLQGQPVDESAIEEALLTLQEFPGLTVFGTFREGARLGETDLLVRVTDEDRFQFTSMYDNYGSEFTGTDRLSMQFNINNPASSRDQLSGYLLRTLDPSNGWYGGLDYRFRTPSGRFAMGFGAARNLFDVTDASTSIDLGLEGEVQQANIFVQKIFNQRRTFRSSGTLDLAVRDAVTMQPGIDPTDELTNLSFTYDFFATGRARRGINLGYLRVLAGDNDSNSPSRLLPDRTPVTGSYNKFEFSYQRLQRMSEHHALLLRMTGQYSSDPLVALEQYSIGGPANVRAYPVAEALIDSGGALSLEYIINAPAFADARAGTGPDGQARTWSDIFQLSFYYDYADGEINDPLPLQPAKVTLEGYGMGVQISQSDRFYIRFDIADPRNVPEGVEDERQYYFSFSLQF